MHIRLNRGVPEGSRASEWQELIWEANRIVPGFFGAPTGYDQHGYADAEAVEHYPDAVVIFRKDGSVSMVNKTDRGAYVLGRAADSLGIHVSE